MKDAEKNAEKNAEIYQALLDDGTQFNSGIATVRKVLGAHRYALGAMIEADDDTDASAEVALNDFRDQLTALATLADAALARWYAHTA